MIELTISERPPAGTGKARGKYVRSTTSRVCLDHALKMLRLVEDPPQGRRAS